MSDIKVLNMMKRPFLVRITDNGKVKETIIEGGKSAVFNKSLFDAAVKGSRALKAHLDQKRLVTGQATGPITTPHAEELSKKSGDAERPETLKDTANAKKGKAQHEVKSVETIEVDAPKDLPKGGKKKKG